MSNLRLHKKKGSLCLFGSYFNGEVADGQQYAELSHDRPVSPQMMNREHPIMDNNITNIQLEDYDYEFSEDEITLCTVTMLGVVLQWQPKVKNIKEVCLKTPQDYSIATAIYDSCTTHERLSSSLLTMWVNQLRAAGFWDDDKKEADHELTNLEQSEKHVDRLS
jgi:hypothetical protein